MKLTLEVKEARLSREPQVIGPGAMVPPGQVILRTPKGTVFALGREEFEEACPEAVFDAPSGRYSVPEFPRFVGAHAQEVEPEEVDVSEFHTGAGWYEIGGRKVRGEKAAREALGEEAEDG